jgi:hypothetical protein
LLGSIEALADPLGGNVADQAKDQTVRDQIAGGIHAFHVGEVAKLEEDVVDTLGWRIDEAVACQIVDCFGRFQPIGLTALRWPVGSTDQGKSLP